MDSRLVQYITPETKADLELLNGKSIPDEAALYVILRRNKLTHKTSYDRIKELWTKKL